MVGMCLPHRYLQSYLIIIYLCIFPALVLKFNVTFCRYPSYRWPIRHAARRMLFACNRIKSEVCENLDETLASFI